MSDSVQRDADNSHPVAGQAQAGGSTLTAGQMLRQAREAAGLHIAALAVSLKVPVAKLEALETDRHELLTDAVFVRALASSVCRALRIDAAPVLERLPRNVIPRLVAGVDGINTPFRGASETTTPGWRDRLSQPAYLVVLALLLGAVVLMLLPSMQHEDLAAAATVPAPAAVTTAPRTTVTDTASQMLAPPVPAASATTPAAASAPPGADSAPAGLASPSLATVAAPAAPTAAIASASAPAARPTEAASGALVIRAKGPSWVEVTDARGTVAVRRMLATGEAAVASGALPLQVTIGKADLTEVQVRGKPFDLTPVSRDNVARFEVR